jgi:hypothetical protein
VLDRGFEKREEEHARCLIIAIIMTATGSDPLPAFQLPLLFIAYALEHASDDGSDDGQNGTRDETLSDDELVRGAHDGRSGRVAHPSLGRDGVGKVGSTGLSDPAPEVLLSSQDGGRTETERIGDLRFPRDVGGHNGLSASRAEELGGHVGLEEEVRKRGGPVGGRVGGHVRGLGITGSSGGELGEHSSGEVRDGVVDDQVLSGLEDGSEQVGTGSGERVGLDGVGRAVSDRGSVLGLIRCSGSGSGLGSDLQDAVFLTGAVLGADGGTEGVNNVQVVIHLPDPLRVGSFGRGQLDGTSRVELTEVAPQLAVVALGGRSTELGQGRSDGRGGDVLESESGQGVKVAGNVVQGLDTLLEPGVLVETVEVFRASSAESSGDHGRRGSAGSTGSGRGDGSRSRSGGVLHKLLETTTY